jgi:hypothetical protein
MCARFRSSRAGAKTFVQPNQSPRAEFYWRTTCSRSKKVRCHNSKVSNEKISLE